MPELIANNFTIQVLGYTALITGVLSFSIRSHNGIRFTSGISSIFWALHYYFLDAFTSSFVQIVLTARAWASIYLKRDYQKNFLFWFTTIVLIIVTYLTWDGYKSLLPLFAAITTTIAFCYMSNQNMRKMLFVSSALWMLNGLIWGSVPQMLAEVIKMLINLYTFSHMSRKGEFTRYSRSSLSDTRPTEMTKEDYELENEIRKQFDHKI